MLLACAAALSLSAAVFDGPILASARSAAPTHRSANDRRSARSHRRHASRTRGAVTGSANPFAGQHFYADPQSPAATSQRQFAAAGDTNDARLMAKVSTGPTAKWFGGWSYGHGGTVGDVNWWVTTVTSAGDLPVLVAYDIPWRDCGSYSSGGAPNATAYESFINGMAQGIAGRHAVVILEPDALAEMGCLTAAQQQTYFALLRYAVTKLRSAGSVGVYLDAGNASWQPAATMATRLRAADVADARGFSLNVSNFGYTTTVISFGTAISNALGGSRFIIDTSRNGQGPAPGGAWCNPPGRGLGTPATSATGNPLVDAFFWVKTPGASDGSCNGGPPAGQWWPQYALALARNAAF